MNQTSMIVVSLLALTTTACVSEMRVHEQIGPISGHLIRTIEGPTDEGGGVRVSGIQTFSREAEAVRAACGSTRTVRRKLCDGRVITRRITAPVAYESGWKVQDSQFFAGPGMAQAALGAAINAAGFAGGMYLGRPPRSPDTNVSVTQQGGGAVAHGGQGGSGGAGGSASSVAHGGQGGSATAGASAVSVANAAATTRSLNRQSQEFHAKNPMRPAERPRHDKSKHGHNTE